MYRTEQHSAVKAGTVSLCYDKEEPGGHHIAEAAVTKGHKLCESQQGGEGEDGSGLSDRSGGNGHTTRSVLNTIPFHTKKV